MTDNQPKRPRRPGGGRKPLPPGEALSKSLRLQLSPDLKAFIKSQEVNESEFVRSLIVKAYVETLII